MQRHTPSWIGLVVAMVSTAVYIGTADAADASAAGGAAGPSLYAKERADCEAGRTAQDRATCLREAGAAAQERQRNGLDNNGVARRNATERCKVLPARDQADCLARIEGPRAANQEVRTSGSVATGGVLRETRTVTVGPVVPAAPAGAASAAPTAPAAAPR